MADSRLQMPNSWFAAGMLRKLGMCMRHDRTNPGFGPRDVAHMETELCLMIMALEPAHG